MLTIRQSSQCILLAAAFLFVADGKESPQLLRRDSGHEPGALNLNSLLEFGDVDSIMEDAGISPSDLNLQSIDTNGDGHLSKEEFKVAKIPEPKRKEAVEKLTHYLEALKKRDEVDKRIFEAADLDGSSFLEEGEIENLLAQTNINREAFDWHAYDKDKDDRLSQPEFLRAGHAAAKSMHSLGDDASASFSEVGTMADDELEDPERLRRHVDAQIFKQADANGDGYLEPTEIKALMSRSGVQEFPWHEHDVDGDGQLSELEFVDAGPSAADHKQAKEIEHQIFQQADTDKSSFLEANEMKALLSHARVDNTRFNWKDHDDDKDGRLSEAEFMKAGKAAEHAALLQSQEEQDDQEGLLGPHDQDEESENGDAGFDKSAADSPESGSTEDLDEEFAPPKKKHDDVPVPLPPWERHKQEDSESGLIQGEGKGKNHHVAVDANGNGNQAPVEEDDDFVFNKFDKDSDGLLNGHEMKKLMKMAGIEPESLEWKKYDTDSDGKLSKKEFANASQVLKDQASAKFRDQVVREMTAARSKGESSLQRTSQLHRHHHKDHHGNHEDSHHGHHHGHHEHHKNQRHHHDHMRADPDEMRL